jgi:hypothetical protein
MTIYNPGMKLKLTRKSVAPQEIRGHDAAWKLLQALAKQLRATRQG